MFAGMFVLIIVLQYLLPKPVNWQRTYSRDDKNPFGTNAVFRLLQPAFTKSVIVNKSTIYNLQSDSLEHYSLFLVNDDINLSKTDLKTLFEFADQGNKVFMAANMFSGLLADTFQIRTSSKSYTYFMSVDSLLKKPGVTLKLSASNMERDTFNYPMLCYDSYFTNYDSLRFRSISFNEDQSSVCIKSDVGRGSIYLMSMPDVFSNYFVVKHPNRKYVYALLSELNNKNQIIIWDEYYKRYNVSKDSFLKFIFDNDALYYAYMMILLTLIVYMVFEGRRRQAAIPVTEPVSNSTLEFVNVVSHVYYNSKNHHAIIQERIRYFYDTVRKRFGISTATVDDGFIQQITDLSGCTTSQIRQLFKYCEKLRQDTNAQEYDLLELNRQIHNFNTNSLR